MTLRLFLVLAAVSVLVPAGSGGAAAAPTSVDGRVAADARCSMATALEVARPLFVGGNSVRRPIGQVLCGPFTGPASEAMAVTLAAPTCWGVQGWAVYRFLGGSWRLTLLRRGVFIFRLDAVGGDIRETAPVFRRGDGRCFPSGGRHARTWHWTGSALTPGPWRTTPATRHLETFLSPDRKVGCAVNPSPDQVWCLTIPAGDGAHFASVTRAGTVTICTTGPADICAQNAVTRAPALRRGERNELRGIRCTGEQRGLTCVVVAGAGRGKGFSLSADGGRRIG